VRGPCSHPIRGLTQVSFPPSTSFGKVL
jgi:hypothetical protein